MRYRSKIPGRFSKGIAVAFCVLAVLSTIVLAADAPPDSVTDDTAAVSLTAPFEQDLRALCATPHRMAGSPEGHAAGNYIERRLREAGVPHVISLGIPTWTIQKKTCLIQIKGKTINALPMQPNTTILPATPPEGLSGPLIYVGSGELSAYGSRSALNAIVVMDYMCLDNWKRAFSMGAKCVVFVGAPADAPHSAMHTGVAANLVRVFVPADAPGADLLLRDQPQATVTSSLSWIPASGRDIIGFLPGTSPHINPDRTESESIVLSVNYDTYGEVPHLSAGARGAANVAALLDAVRYYSVHRPARNIVFMFLDAKTFYHAGARQAYASFMTPAQEFEKYQKEMVQEAKFKRQMLEVVNATSAAGVTGTSEMRNAVVQLMERRAEFFRTDENTRLASVRLRLATAEKGNIVIKAEEERLAALVRRWDDVRRALGSRKFDLVYPENLELLRSEACKVTQRRITELDNIAALEKSQRQLRNLMDSTWVALHVSYNFSDQGSVWGPVVGDQSDEPFRNASTNIDNPGYYSRVLRAFRDAAGSVSGGSSINMETLKDPLVARRYVQGSYASDGMIAGIYGIYNVMLTTCNDRRVRDGHPSDNLNNLYWQSVYRQSRDATMMLERLANGKGISLPRAFSDVSLFRVPEWNSGKSAGDYVSIQVTGSISEDRPACDAVFAFVPGTATSFWGAVTAQVAIPGFERFILAPVDMNGHYMVQGVQKALYTTRRAVGILADSTGQVTYITDNESMNNTFRVNLFPSRGSFVGFPFTATPNDAIVLVMDAVANSAYRPTRCQTGAGEGFSFFYLHRNDPIRRIKLFGQSGPVMLGSSAVKTYGEGFELSRMTDVRVSSNQVTAENLWALNETRLGILRSKKVSDVDIEVLHNRAHRLLEKSKTVATTSVANAFQAQSASLSRQIYHPLRQIMDDLVKGIVILLLLTIPFAFALERLILCATSVYKRILGFAGAFLITFGLLYVMHPGFSIAATPMIVFLAFALILLSSMVISIMARKFKAELMVFQGRSNKAHNVEISRMETLVTAVHMGMSTMRRRPIRTVLTTLTAVMLTFTILCFASFNTSFGVRSFYTGPANENTPASYLIRNVNYQPVQNELFNILYNRIGESGLIKGHWWIANGASGAKITVARPESGESAFFDGMVGISPQEIRQWPALSTVIGFGKDSVMEKNGVFLPSIVQKQLRLRPGDTIVVGGVLTVFAGTFNEAALQRIKHIDGQSIIPVNFQDPSYDTTQQKTGSTTASVAADKIKVQRDYTRLGSNQVLLASDEFVRRLGGSLYLISCYAGKEVNVGEEGKRIAEITGLPVWTRTNDGVERMIFTRLMEVSGGFALFVPLLLGGLIIFGTLLGSITDRQREIYTFSALGLGPAHVGFLFIAEAAVYAIVGGMGGELLAQSFTYGASVLSNLGYIQPLSINFSSTHSLFAIGIVMLTILASAIYPAIKASSSANPGIARMWKMPAPVGDKLDLTFPFTVSAYDITGVVSFLAEYFRQHDDAGLGKFAAQNVSIDRNPQGQVRLNAMVSLAPFDLSVSQEFSLVAQPSDIPGVDEVHVHCNRKSGTVTDWLRANRVFMQELRKQFLLWRTISTEYIEQYRTQTLVELGDHGGPAGVRTVAAEVSA